MSTWGFSMSSAQPSERQIHTLVTPICSFFVSGQGTHIGKIDCKQRSKIHNVSY